MRFHYCWYSCWPCRFYRNYFRPFLVAQIDRILLVISIYLCFIVAVRIYTAFYQISFDKFQFETYGDIYQQMAANDTRPINPLRYSVKSEPKANLTAVELLIMVKTAAKQYANRDAIRATWARPTAYAAFTSMTMFVLGAQPESESRQPLSEEQRLHDDLLFYDLVDTYYNNTLKVMVILDYTWRKFPNLKYLAIVDDDYLVHPVNLVNYLQSVHRLRFGHFVAGTVIFQGQPDRSRQSKWFITYAEYPYEYYPSYPSGGTVVMSRPMVGLLSRALQHVKFMPFDDVLIGIALFKLGIQPVNILGICTARATCKDTRVISSHGYRDPQLLLAEWRQYNLPVGS